MNDRKLPVGIQSFEKIRKGGYLYVDKTDIIWQLANRNKTYNYLSRPRRFGKSLLVDTLEAYFLGKKELFEGLKIMQMEIYQSGVGGSGNYTFYFYWQVAR
jgi:hypothetical protein